MRIIEMVDKLRTPCFVEIRVNNFKVICTSSENIRMVKDELLNAEIFDWFIAVPNLLGQTNVVFNTENSIYG